MIGVEPIRASRRSATKGPYAHGVVVSKGALLMTSGLTGRDASGAIVARDIESQTRQVLENLAAVLAEKGADLTSVVRMTVYITNREDYDGMNRVRTEMLQGVSFASTTLITELHATEALVEIEIMAVLPAAAEVG